MMVTKCQVRPKPNAWWSVIRKQIVYIKIRRRSFNYNFNRSTYQTIVDHISHEIIELVEDVFRFHGRISHIARLDNGKNSESYEF